MSLPFEPESLEVLRERYPLAVAFPPYDMEAVMLGTTARPGEHRRHLFDCVVRIPSGDELNARFIVHRALRKRIVTTTHVSCTLRPCPENRVALTTAA